MNANRKATLDAGAMLLKGWVGTVGGGGYWSPALGDQMETLLVAAFEKARAALDAHRASRGSCIALDALLPGWRHIDASDHLPSEKWNAFVSNDPAEWRAWLVENGVPAKEADGYVTRAFEGDGRKPVKR